MTSRDQSSPERIDNPFAARRTQDAKPGRARPVAPLALRSMTGFEEEVVERLADDPNTARLCNEIVARCLVPPGADHQSALARVRAMTVSERDFALVTVRRLSLGDMVEAEVPCPACRAKNDVRFALSELPLDAVAQRDLDVELPDGTAARLRLPTAGDQEALLDEPLETAAERRTWLIARTLLRLDGHEAPFDAQIAHALPTATRRALEAALEAALPAADLSMRVTCAVCGHAFTEPFDVAGFFLPS